VSARDLLIAAAERRFALDGVNGASMRELTREAGQRNVTALQYHFGGREGLLLAVVDKHLHELSGRVHAELDHVDPAVAREVVAAVVVPMLALADTAEGAGFVQIAAQLLNGATRPPPEGRNPVRLLVDDESGALARWASTLAPHMHPATTGRPLHQRFTTLRFAYSEVARRLRDGTTASTPLFAAHLLDLATALALAAPSEETLRVLTGNEDARRA
jgi:AcrR family transcriptional regulator